MPPPTDFREGQTARHVSSRRGSLRSTLGGKNQTIIDSWPTGAALGRSRSSISGVVSPIPQVAFGMNGTTVGASFDVAIVTYRMAMAIPSDDRAGFTSRLPEDWAPYAASCGI